MLDLQITLYMEHFFLNGIDVLPLFKEVRKKSERFRTIPTNPLLFACNSASQMMASSVL